MQVRHARQRQREAARPRIRGRQQQAEDDGYGQRGQRQADRRQRRVRAARELPPQPHRAAADQQQEGAPQQQHCGREQQRHAGEEGGGQQQCSGAQGTVQRTAHARAAGHGDAGHDGQDLQQRADHRHAQAAERQQVRQGQRDGRPARGERRLALPQQQSGRQQGECRHRQEEPHRQCQRRGQVEHQDALHGPAGPQAARAPYACQISSS